MIKMSLTKHGCLLFCLHNKLNFVFFLKERTIRIVYKIYVNLMRFLRLLLANSAVQKIYHSRLRHGIKRKFNFFTVNMIF